MKVAADVASLGPGGRKLWDDVTAEHVLNPGELVVLLEACRTKDRLDRIAEADWPAPLTVEDSVKLASICGESLRQSLAALRLPDPVTGRRPPRRVARGAYRPRVR